MTISRSLLITSFVVASASAAPPRARPTGSVDADRIEALEARMREMRSELDELRSREGDAYFEASERFGNVRSFLSTRLSLGGFFETGLTGFWGPDTSTQAVPASHTLGLNFAATFSRDLKFVGQLLTTLGFPLQNPDNDASAPTLGFPARRKVEGLTLAAVPAQAYVEYHVSDALFVQGGLGYVPFGYALQQRELVLFVRRGGPQLMRMQDLVEPLWAGVHAGGAVSAGRGRAGYDVYTFPFLNEPSHAGIGARGWWESPEERLRFGLSGQTGRSRTGGATTLGADLRARLGPFALTTEYARRSTEPGDPWDLSLEPNYSLGNFVVYAFVDYGESPLNRTLVGSVGIADPWKKLEYGAGVNWLPTAFTRFRTGVYFFDYRGATAIDGGQDRDFAALDLSAGVAF